MHLVLPSPKKSSSGSCVAVISGLWSRLAFSAALPLLPSTCGTRLLALVDRLSLFPVRCAAAVLGSGNRPLNPLAPPIVRFTLSVLSLFAAGSSAPYSFSRTGLGRSKTNFLGPFWDASLALVLGRGREGPPDDLLAEVSAIAIEGESVLVEAFGDGSLALSRGAEVDGDLAIAAERDSLLIGMSMTLVNARGAGRIRGIAGKAGEQFGRRSRQLKV